MKYETKELDIFCATDAEVNSDDIGTLVQDVLGQSEEEKRFQNISFQLSDTVRNTLTILEGMREFSELNTPEFFDEITIKITRCTAYIEALLITEAHQNIRDALRILKIALTNTQKYPITESLLEIIQDQIEYIDKNTSV